VKMILFRRSGTRNRFFRLESTWRLLDVGEALPA
jgi:hypothetical protein